MCNLFKSKKLRPTQGNVCLQFFKYKGFSFLKNEDLLSFAIKVVIEDQHEERSIMLLFKLWSLPSTVDITLESSRNAETQAYPDLMD